MSGQAFESEALDQLQNSFKRLEVELKDKEYRNLAKKSFQCATKCCINSEANAIDSCVGECTQPLMQYQQFVQQQVQTFQERLQRCQRDCNEEIQDRVPYSDVSKLSVDARAQLQNEMNACTNRCFEAFRQKIPALHSRIKSNISQL